jgi:nucleotide sugar dehydrogenase
VPSDLVVIGLGYVGLPLAQEATRSGITVVGLDTSERVVADLNEGRSHVDDISDDDVAAMRGHGFSATTDPAAISNTATVVICVPTPLAEGGGPDLSAVLAATESVRAHVRAGTLVVLESTTYPGTTDDVVRPALESSGLRVGENVFLAFSPERIDPGNARFGLRNTPKVIGGCTPACLERASAFYGRIVDTVVAARGTREAEMAKLLENTYRHVNIALVNEMARFCHELQIDLWDVIRCASSKPFGFQAFYPGPGVGGHCIPIDPNYLSYTVRESLGYPFRFVELAQEINDSMPEYVTRRIQDSLNVAGMALNGARVLLLGVTYKPDIADQRESPAMPLAERLRELGAEVSFHDPHVEEWSLATGSLRRVDDLDAALGAADISVVLQRHSEYDGQTIAAKAQRALDTRGFTPLSDTVEHL